MDVDQVKITILSKAAGMCFPWGPKATLVPPIHPRTSPTIHPAPPATPHPPSQQPAPHPLPSSQPPTHPSPRVPIRNETSGPQLTAMKTWESWLPCCHCAQRSLGPSLGSWALIGLPRGPLWNLLKNPMGSPSAMGKWASRFPCLHYARGLPLGPLRAPLRVCLV